MELDNCKVLVTYDEIENFSDIKEILNKCINQNIPLCIFCPFISKEVFTQIKMLSGMKNLKLGIVKVNEHPVIIEAILDDISIYTGGLVLAKKYGQTIADARICRNKKKI